MTLAGMVIVVILKSACDLDCSLKKVKRGQLDSPDNKNAFCSLDYGRGSIHREKEGSAWLSR